MLDSLRYAIKKIKLTSAPLIGSSRIMREVFTLSRLAHPNVVGWRLRPACAALCVTGCSSGE